MCVAQSASLGTAVFQHLKSVVRLEADSVLDYRPSTFPFLLSFTALLLLWTFRRFGANFVTFVSIVLLSLSLIHI